MKRDQQTWYCHTVNCGYETRQSVSIAEVLHRCGKGKRLRALKIAPPKKK